MKKSIFVLSVISVLMSSLVASAASLERQDLTTQIKTQLGLSKMSGRGVVEAVGTVYTINKPGVVADPAGDSSYTILLYEDGKLKKPTMFTKSPTKLLEGLAAHAKIHSKPQPVGTKIYITDVSTDKDNLYVHGVTVDALDYNSIGTTVTTSYKMLIGFPLQGGENAEAIIKTISEVLIPFGQAPSTVAQGKTIPSGNSTELLGKSSSEIESVLGKPTNVVKFGRKTVMVYAGLGKVIIEEDRATAIE